MTVGKGFLERTEKAKIINEKNKSDFIKIQNICSKDKSSHRLGKNIYKTYVTEVWYPEYLKNSDTLTIKRQNNQILKGTKDLNRYFTKDTQRANKDINVSNIISHRKNLN